MSTPTFPTKLAERSGFFSFLILCIVQLLSSTVTHAQPGVWTWVSGDNTANNSSVYGTKGIPAAGNKPGSRHSHSGLRDAAGNVWIFGGRDNTGGFNNDLWTYNTGTGEWTWVAGDNTVNNAGVYGTKGVADASNKPGARAGQAAWSDANGNFWMFGGTGYDAAGNMGNLNDLWKYDPIISQWTWLGGDISRNTGGVYGTKGIAATTNKPGARYFLASWTDAAGNFWLSGGQGNDYAGNNGYLNDIWKYNPGTGEWTWVAGDNIRNPLAVYGTKGTPAVTNKPGARYAHNAWMDAGGNIWLFGGFGTDQTNLGYLSDIWKYDITTSQWTWMAGGFGRNVSATYGVRGIAAANNKPGARLAAGAIVDAAGTFWIFGGFGYDQGSSTLGTMNDLWSYNPATNLWTWQKGINTVNSTGVYGTKGISDASNIPGGRAYSATWLDAAGNMWNFGGSGAAGALNDLWGMNNLIALPIQHISLNGSQRNNDNVLTWQTTGEDNTLRFTVERSTNGIDFTTAGNVAAVGTGNNRYTFTDHAVATTAYYYRIQVIDRDGQTHYSPTIIMHGSFNQRINTYPNPARVGITLELTDNSLLNTTANIYTASGKKAGTVRINSLVQHIDLQRFPKGVLTLRFLNGKTAVFVKE